MPMFNEWLRLPAPKFLIEPSVKLDTGTSNHYVRVLDDVGNAVAHVFGLDAENAEARADLVAKLLNDYQASTGR